MIWLVLEKRVKISGRQIVAFQEIIKGNNRPTQPLNGRVVLKQD